MTVEETLLDSGRHRYSGVPEMNALSEADALLEAQLLDVRLHALRSTVWLLFDSRGALQLRQGNTAVVVANGLHRLTWSGNPTTPLTAWSVVGSQPAISGRSWTLSLAFAPTAHLEVKAAAAEFYVGDVPGCDAAPPDYTSDDEEAIRVRLQSWSSQFSPKYAVFLNSAA